VKTSSKSEREYGAVTGVCKTTSLYGTVTRATPSATRTANAQWTSNERVKKSIYRAQIAHAYRRRIKEELHGRFFVNVVANFAITYL